MSATDIVQSNTRRLQKSLPTLEVRTADTREAKFKGKVETSLTEWVSLPLFASFSLCEDGSVPCVKVSRSKAINLSTCQSFRVGGGRCYKLSIYSV